MIPAERVEGDVVTIYCNCTSYTVIIHMLYANNAPSLGYLHSDHVQNVPKSYE